MLGAAPERAELLAAPAAAHSGRFCSAKVEAKEVVPEWEAP